MAAFNKFRQFVEDLAEGVHNFSSDATCTLTAALTATANAPVNTNTVLANLTQISYTNLSSRVIPVSASSQTAGTYTLACTDTMLTASGGSVAAFQYVAIYNDDPTSPADPLIELVRLRLGGDARGHRDVHARLRRVRPAADRVR